MLEKIEFCLDFDISKKLIWFTSSTSFWSSFDNGTSLKSSWPILIISWESWPWYIKEMSHYNTIYNLQLIVYSRNETCQCCVLITSITTTVFPHHCQIEVKKCFVVFVSQLFTVRGAAVSGRAAFDENQFSNLWLVCAKRCKKKSTMSKNLRWRTS